MSLLFSGIIIWVVGKIAHIKIIETLGMIAVYAAIALWAIGLIGIYLPFSLPF